MSGGGAVLVVRNAHAGAPARPTPFDVAVLVGSAADGRSLAVPTPGMVLYVDDGCHFCARELDGWATTLKGDPAASVPTIVVSPRSDPSGGHVPPALRDRIVHDRDGRIAAALGVQAVPFLADFASVHRVVMVHAGVTSDSMRTRLASGPPRLPPGGSRDLNR